jgi:hypothetical protein
MRDELVKSGFYFAEFIKKKNEIIAHVTSSINTGGVTPENIHSTRNLLFIKSLERLIAIYSSGESLETMRAEYNSTLKLMEEGWHDTVVKFKMGRPQIVYDKYFANHYCYMIWMLSLAILLRVSEREITILKTIIDKGSIDDDLIHFLLQDNFPNPTRNGYKPFKSLLAKNTDETNKNDVKKYLDKWYQNTNLLTWHNYKSSIETSKYYYGYWCFEAAAIVALLDLDDSSFRENQYYPKDLVDYYRSDKNSSFAQN